MSLVNVGTIDDEHTQFKHEVFFDTDDLEQPEYRYYSKALSMGKRVTANLILTRTLDVYTIENSEKYQWLADKEGSGEDG